jgi:hypothetical protein
MDADLFSPADTAALLAIRAALADRRLGAADLRALFDASGLTGAMRRADGAPASPAKEAAAAPITR